MRSPRRCLKEFHLLGDQQGAELRGEVFNEILVRGQICPMGASVGVIVELPEV
jgi:hypothetical protein